MEARKEGASSRKAQLAVANAAKGQQGNDNTPKGSFGCGIMVTLVRH